MSDLWPAPRPTDPVDRVVSLPGSKSLTNRALVLAVEAFEECADLFECGRGGLGRPLVETAGCLWLEPGEGDLTLEQARLPDVIVAMNAAIPDAIECIALSAADLRASAEAAARTFEAAGRRFLYLVPSAAVQRGSPGTFVYVVKEDQTVGVRSVTVGVAHGEEASIDQGLAVAPVDERSGDAADGEEAVATGAEGPRSTVTGASDQLATNAIK